MAPPSGRPLDKFLRQATRGPSPTGSPSIVKKQRQASRESSPTRTPSTSTPQPITPLTPHITPEQGENPKHTAEQLQKYLQGGGFVDDAEVLAAGQNMIANPRAVESLILFAGDLFENFMFLPISAGLILVRSPANIQFLFWLQVAEAAELDKMLKNTILATTGRGSSDTVQGDYYGHLGVRDANFGAMLRADFVGQTNTELLGPRTKLGIAITRAIEASGEAGPAERILFPLNLLPFCFHSETQATADCIVFLSRFLVSHFLLFQRVRLTATRS